MKVRSAHILYLLMIFSSVGLSISETNKPSDYAALMDLYVSTGGDEWDNNDGWGKGMPSNSWHGLRVNGQGRVVSLDLFKNGLRGHLPESIGQLTDLEYLNVKQNTLTGPVPNSIGNLKNLVYLLLSGTPEAPPRNPQHNVHQGKKDKSGNTFSGQIPPQVGNLLKLEYFELSGSQITGTIPEEIGNAQNLKFISLSWNPSLTGGIPPSIGKLQNLIWFYARASSLDGLLPAELGQLTSLRTFHVGYNTKHGGPGLQGPLPDLSKLTKLRNFNIDQNNFSGRWPNYWNNGSFTNLITLQATWNAFSTEQLHGFDNLKNLIVIALSGNDIGGKLPSSINQLHQAIIISLGWTKLHGELPQTGWDFDRLRLVYLNDNNLSGHVPGSFFEAADNPALRWLYLQNNRFTSIDSTAINSMSSPVLETIDVSGNSF